MFRIVYATLFPAALSGFCRRWASLLVLAGILLPVTVLQPYSNGPPIRSDGLGYHLWHYALVTGRLNFAWFEGDYEEAGLHPSDEQRLFWTNKYPPGVALVRLPFMLPFADLSHPPGRITWAEHTMALVLGAAALLACAALMLNGCRRLGVSNGNSHLAVLALTFGTGLFHYASYDASFSHIYSALGVALLTWLSVRAIQGDGRLPFLVTMVTVAILILIRNTNGLFVIIWAAFYFAWVLRARHPACGVWIQNVVGIGCGLTLSVSVQLALNYIAFRRLTFSSYGTETFLWNRPMMGSVLLSYERGLFTYYPILALVLALGLYVRRTRWAALGLTLLVLAYAGLYGFWHSWMLGGGFGHRGFVEFAPVAILIFAVSLDALGGRLHTLVVVLCGLCLFVTVCLMGGYWCGSVPCAGVTANVYWSSIFRFDRVLRVWFFSHWG
jgi:hypothetical protein